MANSSQGETVAATQAVLAGAIKNSRLLGDFMDLTLREQNALFAPKLEHRLWNDYIAGCRARFRALNPTLMGVSMRSILRA